MFASVRSFAVFSFLLFVATSALAQTGRCVQPWWKASHSARGDDSTWMAANYERLCTVPLREMAIPGSHDTGTYGTGALLNERLDGGVFAPDQTHEKRLLSLSGPVFALWAQNQEKDAYTQLADGIRYFDLRVCADDAGRLLTCHGLYGASIDSILNDVRRFTDSHPGEVVILGFNHFWDGVWQRRNNHAPGTQEGMRDEMWQQLVATVKTKLEGRLVSGQRFNPDSTLADLASASSQANPHQVIVLFAKGNVQDQFIWNDKEGGTWTPGWEREPYLESVRRTLQSPPRGAFWAVRSCVTQDAELIGRGLDPTGTYPKSLKELADQTNPVVLGFLKQWHDESPQRPINLIWADFYNRSDLVTLAKYLNGIPVNWASTNLGRQTSWGHWKLGVSAPFVALAESRVADCPSGYTNNGLTCGRGAHSIAAGSRVANCPSGFTNMGLTCYQGPDTYAKGCTTIFKKYSCRAGYTDNGCFCGKGATSRGASSMSCPSGYFLNKSLGRCYKNCPSGYTNMGETCYRGPSTLGMDSMTCLQGESRSGPRCYPNTNVSSR